MTPKAPKPPGGLGDAGRVLWRDVCARYELDPAELLTLRELCRTADELDRLAAMMADHDPVVKGSRGQPVASPLMGEIRRHRVTFERLARALALPVAGEEVGSVRSPGRAYAARTRWRKQGIRAVRDGSA